MTTDNENADGMHSYASSTTRRPSISDDHTLKLRPWRRYVTNWSAIINEPYKGSGTEEDPYVVDWLHGGDGKHARDPENPMTWRNSYKWIIVVTVAIATLAVSMASSTLSAATTSIMQSFPGYKTQVYVLGECGGLAAF